MKKLLVGFLVVVGLWYFGDSGSDEIGKQQYTFDLMCALVTGSDAMRKEANRMDSILVKKGIVMNEGELISARNHWLKIYSVSSYEELTQNPEFLMTCNYNACVYEGNDKEVCIENKVDSCLDLGLSYSECFPK